MNVLSSNLAIFSSVLPIIIAIAVLIYRVVLEFALPSNKQSRAADLQVILSDFANTAVRSAEQSGASSSAKKTQATNDVSLALKSAGINVPPQLVDSAIEASVYYLNQLTGSFTGNTSSSSSVSSSSDASIQSSSNGASSSPVQV